MNEALRSILSGGDEWYHNSDGRHIKFNKDGTGELWCRSNFNYWILAVIEWKAIKPPHGPSQIVEFPNQVPNTVWNKAPQLLGHLDIEITLTKRLPKVAETSVLAQGNGINERNLTDDAFQTRLFTVRIEKGNFVEPACIGHSNWRYELRLTFDKSPYPPREQWKDTEYGPDQGQYWNIVEFVSRHVPGLEKQGKPMNVAPTGLSACAVS
ncbi:uncharacterized protein GGS22DRAFT_110608 [Annulohypoxylon maeteangense]|uniref:uncharacterized protein n=1 Tax=Annulohypoxylon maeteangense TaxID=1927788 RepID=UPI002008641D|nr:uncharacterized protein GGS22DRAFT_110608 [Annulohypoxylon maeteangense]KAI0887520.1 hypothetical protein GGS22DRAFT_110608 [Annulohypoxylon maeteangense]